MKRNRNLAGAVLLALGLQATLVVAQEVDHAMEIEAARPQVSLGEDGVVIEAPAVVPVAGMKVRVYDAAGVLVFSSRSGGASVDVIAADLPDGEYRFEAVSIYLTVREDLDDAARAQGEFEGMSRASGRFTVIDGRIALPAADQVGLFDTLGDGALVAVGWALDVLVGSAHAQDVVVDDVSPQVFFDDTSAANGTDWIVEGNSDTGDTSGFFRIQSLIAGNSQTVFQINSNTTTANVNSIVIQGTGDIEFGGGEMFFESTGGELAIGSQETPSDLNLYSITPDLRFHDETDDSWIDLQLNAGQFEVFADTTTTAIRSVMGIDVTAPDDSLTIDNQGLVSSVTGFQAPFLYAFSDANPVFWMANTTTGANNLAIIDGQEYRQGPFAANFPILSYDLNAPANSFHIAADGNVGFGTNNPFQAVEVARDGAARFAVTSYTSTPTESAQYIMRRARGTEAAPTAVQNNDNLGLFSFRGHNGVNMGGSRAAITAQAAGNFTNSSTPTRLIFATTPVGSTTPQQVMVINANGTVSINGQNLNVPDYVFEDDYELMSLDELRAFIEANRHLPGVAPAREVNAEGLDIAGAQLSVLEKVEELTLYTLQQHDEIGALRSENASLRGELAAVREHQAALQAQVGRIEDLERLVGLLMEGHGEAELFTALTR